MTQRASYLSVVIDELEAYGIAYKKRLLQAQLVFSSSNSAQVKNILYKNHISYLYMQSKTILPVATTSSWVKVVFDNGDKKIYQVLFN